MPWLLGLLLCAACGSLPPQPGIELTAVDADPHDFDRFVVSWRSTGDTSFQPQGLREQTRPEPPLLQLEWSVDSGPFQIYPVLFGASPVTVDVDPATPEAAQISFRGRGAFRSGISQPGPPVRIRRGLRPASDVSVQDREGISLSLRWKRQSAVADGIRIERRAINLDQSAGPWEVRPGVLGSETSYQEKDLAPWLDGHALEYRVFYTLGDLQTAPVSARSGYTRPLPPTNANATSDGSAVVLTWTNASSVADHVQILSAFNEVALVPATPPIHRIDAVSPGLHAYDLRSVVGTFSHISNYVSDAAAHAAAFVPPAGTTFPARPLRASSGDVAVRAPDGRFVTGCTHDGTNLSALGVNPPDGPRYQTTDSAEFGGLLLDASGRPHLVYLQGSPLLTVGRFPVEHAQLDGIWKKETIATPSPVSVLDTRLYAGIDRSGALHVLYWSPLQPPPNPPHHATNIGDAWSEELVEPHEGPVAFSGFPAAVRDDGSPAFLVSSNNGYLLVARGADGWHSEQIPGTSSKQPVALLSTSADSTFAFFLTADATHQRTVLELHERTGTGWQDGVPVASWGVGSAPGDMTFAISADGSRLAFVENSTAPALHLREGGSWRTFPLAPDYFLTCGFTPAGKAWVLGGLGGLRGCGGEQDFVVYDEP